MKVKGDDIIFSTGKVVYANNGLIGLSEPDELGWEVSEGYDGKIYCDDLTKEENIEMANYMIDLWCKFLKLLTRIVL